jgi:hypothetical protein
MPVRTHLDLEPMAQTHQPGQSDNRHMLVHFVAGTVASCIASIRLCSSTIRKSTLSAPPSARSDAVASARPDVSQLPPPNMIEAKRLGIGKGGGVGASAEWVWEAMAGPGPEDPFREDWAADGWDSD